MGYMKEKLLEQVIEEPDRILTEPTGKGFEKPAHAILTRRKLRNHRRQTYRAPKHWVVTNFDMTLIWLMVPMAFVLGACVGILMSMIGAI